MAGCGSIETVAIRIFSVRAVEKLREVGFTVGDPINDVHQLSIPIKRNKQKLNLYFYPSGFKPKKKEDLDKIIIRQVRILVVMASLIDALFQIENKDILKQVKKTPKHMLWFSSININKDIGININGMSKFTHTFTQETLIPIETDDHELTWDFSSFAAKLFFQPIFEDVDSEGCETPPVLSFPIRQTSTYGLSRDITIGLGKQISAETQLSYIPEDNFVECAQQIEFSDIEDDDAI